MPEDIHHDRELIDSYLRWLNSKVSGLHKQASPNKNQIQELLLGIGLALRDLDFVNFVEDYEAVFVPPYLISSAMEAKHLPELAKAIDGIQKVVQHYLR